MPGRMHQDDSREAVSRRAADAMQGWRDRIAARLRPLDSYDPQASAAGSDADLNPELGVTAGLQGLSAAAVLIALVERADGFSVLFTRRSDGLRRHAGQIAFPGGRCDPGETPSQTALREAQEEIGLDPALVQLAGLSTPYRTLTGYFITPVVGYLRPGFDLTLNPAEVVEVFEAPFDFLMDPANHERRHRDQPPGPPRWHYAIPYKDWLIWGVTAGMIRALHDRLGLGDGA
jgi:8-oxo-dGTP pyrophosphatase MutT (NUDIX family)